MNIPKSFFIDGFRPPGIARARRASKSGRPLKGLLIGSDGEPNTGKTEFILSAPGPGLVIVVDRGFDAMLDNPNPPPTRRDDFCFAVIQAPIATQLGSDKLYKPYWQSFYEMYMKALANADAVTVGVDGDSDTWELQRLAEFGKLTQIPSIMYTNVNAARRAMYNRAWDSGKIIIATNKITPEYIEEKDDKGNPILDNSGKPKRKRSGEQVRQGFADQEYLWQIQLRHLYQPATTRQLGSKTIEVPQQWGIRIMMCKANKGLEGQELWGSECNFKSLVQLVYKNVPLEDWGY